MKKYLPLFISGLLMIFVGLYMILRPDSFLTVVISVFGIYLIVDGIRTMIASYKLRDVFGRGLRNMSAAKALIDIILGVVVVIIAIASPSLIPTLIVYIAAAAFLVSGIIDAVDLAFLSRAGIALNTLLLETVLSFVFSIILFLFPNFLTGVVMTLFAAILFASGAMMVYGSLSSAFYARKIRKEIESR